MIDALATPETAFHDAGATIAAFTAARPRLHALTLAECAAAAPRGYIVKGLIGPLDLVVPFGPPGCGKSVIVPRIAHAVATGTMIFGRRVRLYPVLYIAAEDGHGMQHRLAALRDLCGDTPDLRLIAEAPDLWGDPTARHEPADVTAIRAIASRMRAGLIIVDTVARAFPGLVENENADMQRAARLLRSLGTPADNDDAKAWTGAAVVAVHHAPKGDANRPRGHGALEGDADLTMRIEGERGEPRRITLGKNRSGSSVDSFGFTIRPHELGIDEDGDAITAPIAEEMTDEVQRFGRKITAESKLNDASALLLRTVRTLIDSSEAQRIQPAPGYPFVTG